MADGLSSRLNNLEREAAQVCDWLHEMTGLVQAEPTVRS
jgi:hypothetical protein